MTALVGDPPAAQRGSVTVQQVPASRVTLRGRQAEQKIILDVLRRAGEGHGGVALIDGEPGIGKSLLLHDAADAAAERGFSLATGAADPLGHEIPFFSMRCALRDLWSEPTADAPGSHAPDGTAWWISRIRSRIEERATAAPVLVCLDDLQYEAPAALAALRALPGDLKCHPVAWILARSCTRQPEAEYLFGQLEKDGAAHITLTSLDDETVTAILCTEFGAQPDEALRDLGRGAAGNPMLISALAEGLREERTVRVSRGQATLVSDRLPARIHGLARRRLGVLSKQARQLVVTAAVLGPAFRLDDAAEMLAQTPAALLPAVEEAMDAAILAATADTFAFRQQLFRRAVSELMPHPAQIALHRQYGDILLNRGGAQVLAASHLLQAAHAGDLHSLGRLDTAAAQILRSAPRAAADLALRALELTAAASPARLSRAVAAAEALAAAGLFDQAGAIARSTLTKPRPQLVQDRLRCVLSAVLCAAGKVSEAAAEAAAVLARPNLPDGVRDLALTAQLHALSALHDGEGGLIAGSILATPDRHDHHTITAALVIQASVSLDEGDISGALARLRQATLEGAGISTDARHVQPLLVLAAVLIDLRQLGEAVEILNGADNAALPQISSGPAMALLRGRVHLAAGRLADAESDLQAALSAAESLGACGYAATARSVLGVIKLRGGDIAAATDHLACRADSSPQFADIYARSEAFTADAQLTEAREGPSGASGQLRRMCAEFRDRPGRLLGDPAFAAWISRTALAAGTDELAACAVGAARTLANARPECSALAAAASHCRGVARGDSRSLSQAAAQHADPWARASAAEDLGVLYDRRGERDLAIGHLKDALAGYGRAAADGDQARIRRRLRRLGVRQRHWSTSPDQPVSGSGSLTSTEQVVAALVAEGLSNGHIADRMYISPHTVAHHLRQIFRKLSITSRVELTRIVVEQAASDRAS